MRRCDKPAWRAIRIPCRLVDEVYGVDNFDCAGDDLVNALQTLSDYPNQYHSRFSVDTTHPNPWYHTLVFEINGIPDSAYEQFVEKLSDLGLAGTSDTA